MAVGLLAGLDPPFAVAATLGLAFMAVVVADLAAGLAVFTVIAFVDVLPFGAAAVTLSKGAGLLLAVAWLAVLATRRDAANDFFNDHPVLSYLLLAFLGWTCASLLWAEDPGAGLTAIYRYGLSVLLFLVVYTAVRTRKHVIWVTAAFLAGAFVSVAYGIVSPPPPENASDVSRLAGFNVGANQLAALLVAAVALAGAFAAGWRRSVPIRLVALAVIPVCAFGIVFSFSRGGLVALGVALVAAVVLGGRWRLTAAVFLAAISLAAGGYIAFFATPRERERVTHFKGGGGRTDIWTVGWRMVESSPTNGIGVGNFPVSSVHFLLEPGSIKRDDFIVDQPKLAHNIYLEVLAELGVVGLVLFLPILCFSLSAAVRAAWAFERTGDVQMELMARAVAIALIALLTADFFVSDQFSKQLWLLLALSAALLRIAQEQESEASARSTEISERAPAATSLG